MIVQLNTKLNIFPKGIMFYEAGQRRFTPFETRQDSRHKIATGGSNGLARYVYMNQLLTTYLDRSIPGF